MTNGTTHTGSCENEVERLKAATDNIDLGAPTSSFGLLLDLSIIHNCFKYPLLYIIQNSHSTLASSVVELVKTSGLVSRRLRVRIPPKNVCEVVLITGSQRALSTQR